MDNAAAKHKDCFGLTGGLSGTQIKIAGVIMMVFDHLYYMFNTNGIPSWFHWLGRPVAPMFLFICTEGFAHTRSRKRYLLQLLAAYELMNIISTVLGFALPNENIMLIFSIFGSLFFAALYMLFIDMFRDGVKTKKPGTAALAVLLMVLPIVYSMATMVVLSAQQAEVPQWLTFVLFKFIPNIMVVEGNLVWMLFGALFYILRQRRILQVIPLVLFGIICLFTGSIEWLVIFAAVPVLLYNGSRGKGGKYFFYIFYPAHIYLFYIIAYLLQKK
ncbi:MAG: conjugal transfer protein TraX [Treponema sp.]|jgi:hypothetical protein|nr:conjugal transfer protein TraX [Treponema sp.]